MPITRLTPDTKVSALLDAYPFLLEFLTRLSPKFGLLTNPLARRTVGAVATLGQAASIGGMSVDALLSGIAGRIREEAGEDVQFSAGESHVRHLEDEGARHEVLKAIIRDLHAGESVDSVKARFRELIRDIDASEISKMEQRLIEEGMPSDEVKRLCDVHVQVFQESLEEKDVPVTPEGHPVHTFMLENRASEDLMNSLEAVCERLGDSPDEGSLAGPRDEPGDLLSELLRIDLHYQRKEYQLFPALEKHGISGPTQVMWALHDDIRAMLKNAVRELREGAPAAFIKASREAIRTIREMIYKEERILFPVCIDTLSSDEWDEVRRGETEIGYAWIEPAGAAPAEALPAGSAPAGAKSARAAQSAGGEMNAAMKGGISLDTGVMTAEQINLMLKSLPLDISFVDENDEVAYYSATHDRIFPRSPGIIGRKVQNCHPPGSLNAVQTILDDFRSGKRDTAEFWITMQGRFIHIRYFALRDAAGVYKGCIEVSQDVTGIRALEGEKRLLD